MLAYMLLQAQQRSQPPRFVMNTRARARVYTWTTHTLVLCRCGGGLVAAPHSRRLASHCILVRKRKVGLAL
eukprot:scaffold39431_cov34-Tisochrysis_lutea.AAC.1